MGPADLGDRNNSFFYFQNQPNFNKFAKKYVKNFPQVFIYRLRENTYYIK